MQRKSYKMERYRLMEDGSDANPLRLRTAFDEMTGSHRQTQVGRAVPTKAQLKERPESACALNCSVGATDNLTNTDGTENRRIQAIPQNEAPEMNRMTRLIDSVESLIDEMFQTGKRQIDENPKADVLSLCNQFGLMLVESGTVFLQMCNDAQYVNLSTGPNVNLPLKSNYSQLNQFETGRKKRSSSTASNETLNRQNCTGMLINEFERETNRMQLQNPYGQPAQIQDQPNPNRSIETVRQTDVSNVANVQRPHTVTIPEFDMDSILLQTNIYSCALCGKVFVRKSSFSNHLKSHLKTD